jgi:hypothetical protein
VRSLRREVSLILRKQDLMLRALVPEVKPTKEELKIIKKRKEFGTEKELFKALR